MPAAAEALESVRSETINLRASRSQKAIIDEAARVSGRSRTDFMLASACREAESVLLDRRYFALSGAQLERFERALDRTPAPNARLKRLLRTTPPWER